MAFTLFAEEGGLLVQPPGQTARSAADITPFDDAGSLSGTFMVAPFIEFGKQHAEAQDVAQQFRAQPPRPLNAREPVAEKYPANSTSEQITADNRIFNEMTRLNIAKDPSPAEAYFQPASFRLKSFMHKALTASYKACKRAILKCRYHTF